MATTTPDGLPYPDDYQDPADSPMVLEALATATQTALTARAAATHTHDGRYSPTGHTHTPAEAGAAAASHSHGEYAGAGHGHDPGAIGAAYSGHGHSPGQVGIAITHHGPYTLASGADSSYTVPHGLGTVPRAVLIQAFEDDGYMTIACSVGTWDGVNVTARVGNWHSASETFRLQVVAIA